MLAAEDPDLRVSAGVARDCTVIRATSEAHLEQVVDRLKREFEVEASVGRLTVAYVETLTRSAEGSAKHLRISTIHGNPARGTEILNNELYVGRFVWNRLRYIRILTPGNVSRDQTRRQSG